MELQLSCTVAEQQWSCRVAAELEWSCKAAVELRNCTVHTQYSRSCSCSCSLQVALPLARKPVFNRACVLQRVPKDTIQYSDTYSYYDKRLYCGMAFVFDHN